MVRLPGLRARVCVRARVCACVRVRVRACVRVRVRVRVYSPRAFTAVRSIRSIWTTRPADPLSHRRVHADPPFPEYHAVPFDSTVRADLCRGSQHGGAQRGCVAMIGARLLLAATARHTAAAHPLRFRAVCSRDGQLGLRRVRRQRAAEVAAAAACRLEGRSSVVHAPN
jgi:hypothetical protein